MNEIIIERWNKIVKQDDIVYHLGDVFMGSDKEAALKMVARLKGKIYLAYGNHDSDNRKKVLSQLPNIVDVQMGYCLKSGKKGFILTHYPTLTGNTTLDHIYSLHGHTHQKTNFTEGLPLCYHIGVDSHNCTPVAFDEIIEEIRSKNK